jgi:hypothetical protein
MPALLAEEVSGKWRTVCSHFQAHCLKLLSPFFTDMGQFNSAWGRATDGAEPSTVLTPELSADRFAQFKSAWSDFAVVATAGSIGVSLVSIAIVGSWFPPLAVVAVGAAVWAGVRGWKTAGARQVKEAQHKLREALGKQLQQARSYFLDVDIASGRSGRIDEYLAAAERTVAAQVGKLAATKLEETQAELQRLRDVARLDDEQRRARSKETRAQRAQWGTLGREIQALQTELRELDHSSAAAAATRS